SSLPLPAAIEWGPTVQDDTACGLLRYGRSRAGSPPAAPDVRFRDRLSRNTGGAFPPRPRAPGRAIRKAGGWRSLGYETRARRWQRTHSSAGPLALRDWRRA